MLPHFSSFNAAVSVYHFLLQLMELSTTTFKPPAISNLSITPKKLKNNPQTLPTIMAVSLDDLCDTLLTEILHRVATPKDSARCKAVCKRWRSLVSCPYFITLFIRFHASSFYYQTHSTVLLSFTSQISKNPSIFIPINFECYRSLDLTFSSLPEREGALKVVASCNDLLLLSGDKGLYVHNPLTRQSIGISLISKGYVQYGLVTEPYYTPNKNGNKCGSLVLNDEFQFAVICFTEEIDMGCYVVDVFCPRSGKKNSYVLSGPDRNYEFCSNVVGCVWSRKLYWYNGSQVVAFDPFNSMTDHTFFIDASALNLPLHQIKFCDHCIGFPRRQMKIMQLVVYSYENRETTTLSIWRLEHKTGRWFLANRFTFQALVKSNTWFNKFMNGEKFSPRVLGFHPTDDDIVFLDMMNCVLLCGLSTLRLSFTGNILTSGATHYNHDNVFPLMQPWWPSPLGFDAPAQNAKNGRAFTCFSV